MKTPTTLLSPWIRRFLLEHLTDERNLALNTQKSYRDTLRRLLPFVARHTRRPIDCLEVYDLSSDRIRKFLHELERQYMCGVATRNQRLAAIRSMARFISQRAPEHLQWYGELNSIPVKRAPRPLVTYLEKDEMDALLAAPDPTTEQGRRDHAVLLFLYNTGARADEVAHVQVADLELGRSPSYVGASILLHGKGNKLRRCPLWPKTAAILGAMTREFGATENVFLNRRGQPLTRFGIHAIVERYAKMVAITIPVLANKHVSPHVIRHTTATHLLRAGVDINTIRAWLGHVSLTTTNIYAEVDLEMKAQALARCEIKTGPSHKPWRQDAGLMEFLRTL
jgi:integrase/recombinase XerD